MRYILTLIVFTGLFISCNSTDKASNTSLEASSTESTSNNEKANYIPIDNDEALVATALMAAPEESRSGCKVIGYNMAG
jgi:hypothetical protein